MSFFEWLFGRKSVAAPKAATKLHRHIEPLIQPPVDWRNSEKHLAFLKLFLNPKIIAHVSERWELILGESPKGIIGRYIKGGMLVPIPLKAKVAYGNNIPDLKKLLKERGLKVSGNKSVLLERLLNSDETGMAELYKADTMFECAPEIRPQILQYVADKEAERNDAVAGALAAVRIRDFAKASQIIGAYESKKLDLSALMEFGIDGTPRTVERDVEELKFIFSSRPKILSKLSENDWESLHIASALGHLLHGGWSTKWLPEDFVGVSKFNADVALRMMQFHFINIQAIERMRALNITQGRISCVGENGGTCSACMELDGRVGKFDSLPELPYEKCTCALGCRCYIKAI